MIALAGTRCTPRRIARTWGQPALDYVTSSLISSLLPLRADEGGYGPGTLTTNTSCQLTTQEAQSFRSKVEGGESWNAPNPVNDQTGTDGSDWIIEGVKAARYHVIDRWSPTNGPAHELGLFLAFDLASLSIPKNEVY